MPEPLTRAWASNGNLDETGLHVFIDLMLDWGFQSIVVENRIPGMEHVPFPLVFKGKISRVFIYWFTRNSFERTLRMDVQVEWDLQRTRFPVPHEVSRQYDVPLNWGDMIAAVRRALDLSMRIDESELVPERGVPPGMDRPPGLSPAGVTAWKTLVAFFKKHGLTHTGGGVVFYSPSEWAARGEPYALGVELIVTYDGTEAREVMRGEDYELYEAMQATLEKKGLLFQDDAGWYGGIYRANGR